jgi:hypothetical protein
MRSWRSVIAATLAGIPSFASSMMIWPKEPPETWRKVDP